MIYKNIPVLILLALFLGQIVGAAGPTAVNLGSASNFVILSKSGISTTGTSSIVGNIGVSPAAATYVTGFGLILNSSTQFATSKLVSGRVYAADYSAPTPEMLTSAVGDMQTAYTNAAGRTNPTATELGAGNIGGMTLTPGLYKWSTGLIIPTSVTLDCNGNSSSVFIFQIAQTLSLSNGASILLSGGCTSSNIFWQVAGQATLGTTSNFQGVILSQTAIVMNTGATLSGRALAQTSVTLSSATLSAPSNTAITTTSPTTTNGSTLPTTTIAKSTTAPTTSIATIYGSATSTVATTAVPTTTVNATISSAAHSGTNSVIIAVGIVLIAAAALLYYLKINKKI